MIGSGLEGDFAWLDAWDLPTPVALRPTGHGINNRTFFVDTPAGTRFLRIYQNTRDPARVRYEHRLLDALRSRPLSFATPLPVPTSGGPNFVQTPGGGLAALFELLPGDPPDWRHDGFLASYAAALGELHGALAGVDVGPALPVDDLLDFPPSEGGRVDALLAELREAVPALYATLPTQLCHNDYSPGNTLQRAGRVSAVLDFEFAGPNLRALDVATAWYWSVRYDFDTGRAQAIGRAFFDAYRSRADLTAAEARALPTLARLQRAVALVHWRNRARAGLDPHGLYPEQQARLLALDDFLLAHADELVHPATG